MVASTRLTHPLLFADVSGCLQFVWFLANWAAIVLGVLTSQSVGLLIGAAMPQFETAQTTATIVILSFMLASGFWIQQIPSFLFWLKCAATLSNECKASIAAFTRGHWSWW